VESKAPLLSDSNAAVVQNAKTSYLSNSSASTTAKTNQDENDKSTS
jgi:hypothetical protein